MKNRLESELISIAHRILKLKNKSEVTQLQQETLQLYEKLSVLRFVEENYQDSIVEIPSDIEEKLKTISDSQEKKIIQTKETSEVTSLQNNTSMEELFSEKENPDPTEYVPTQTLGTEPEITEEKKSEIISSQNNIENKELFSEENTINTQDNKMNFEDFEAQLSNAKPKKNNVFFQEEIITVEESISSTEAEFHQTKKSDKTNLSAQKSLDIRLNDRVAFEFHLFNGETENFQRVISLLSTFDTFEQAKDFIENVVKPDYNNWLTKEEYETRFMQIVENRFM